jgi:hypothetical protein
VIEKKEIDKMRSISRIGVAGTSQSPPRRHGMEDLRELGQLAFSLQRIRRYHVIRR